jgi:ankyrin repeat protein
MSAHDESAASGDQYALDHLRQQAKRLLKQARARDAVVVSRLRALLPRLAALDDATLADTIQLADVQQAIALKLGHENWAALKQLYSRLQPVHRHVAQFLRAVRDDDTSTAVAVITAAPDIVHANIHVAAAAGAAAVVHALVAADPALAKARIPGDDVDPLMYAVADDIKRQLGVSIEQQVATVRALLDAGADPNATVQLPDRTGAIPALYFPCVSGNEAVARVLLERGARPTDGESVYHAAQHDHTGCLVLLVEYGADLHRGPDTDGNTPLHFLAAHTPQNRIAPQALRGMRWLLEHGADPTVRSYPGRRGHRQADETPLHRAAAVGHSADVLQMLVAHGADIAARRGDGATAYQLAMRAGNTAAAQALASLGADTTLSPTDQLLSACLRVDALGARAVLAENPDLLTTLGVSERDALGLALTSGQFDAARLMIALGWPLTEDGEWGGTPLHWAAWNGFVDVVRLLLAAGAPVNQRDSRYGSSPIAWCAHGSRFCGRANDEDYPAIVHLLLDAGATRPEAYNQWNEAPESLARPSVVAVMRARGFAV